ncbi:MAG: signal peptide peptidase SppA [Planctomycetota bacterium]
MDQSPRPGQPGPMPGVVHVQAPPAVVHVAARPGGFGRAVALVLGLFLFGLVFLVGVTLGVVVMVSGGSLERVVLRQTYRDGGRTALAIIPVRGTIDERRARFVRAAADHVLGDSSIRGVVLRVDSPGGGVAASDRIWREVARLKEEGLPVVASFGGVAASGGYYVACGTDDIVAEETCITGSIGVIAQLFTMEQLMEKVCVQPVTLVATDSPRKDVANDIFRSWNDDDRATVRRMLDAAHDTFRRRVRDGRGTVITEPARIDALADGSVYTAAEALDAGLIDAVGYLDDAIARLEKQAGLRTGSSRVFRLVEPPTLFGNGLLARRRPAEGVDAETVRSMLTDLAAPRVMYLMH